jgi:hypothetical protein
MSIKALYRRHSHQVGGQFNGLHYLLLHRICDLSTGQSLHLPMKQSSFESELYKLTAGPFSCGACPPHSVSRLRTKLFRQIL